MRLVTIRRGHHRSIFKWLPFLKDTKTFTFLLRGTAKYVLSDSNQEAINKLIGFSDGTLNHHKNSFRIGWNYDVSNDKIALYFYNYVDGERVTSFIKYILVHQKVKVKVTCKEGFYQVKIDGDSYQVRRSYNIKCRYKHMLWTYFGGVRKAPHDINLFLKWK